MAVAFEMRSNHAPPRIGIALGKVHHTNAGIRKHREFSVNIPTVFRGRLSHAPVIAAPDNRDWSVGEQVGKARSVKASHATGRGAAIRMVSSIRRVMENRGRLSALVRACPYTSKTSASASAQTR